MGGPGVCEEFTPHSLGSPGAKGEGMRSGLSVAPPSHRVEAVCEGGLGPGRGRHSSEATWVHRSLGEAVG